MQLRLEKHEISGEGLFTLLDQPQGAPMKQVLSAVEALLHKLPNHSVVLHLLQGRASLV